MNNAKANPLIVQVPVAFSVRLESEVTGMKITHGFAPGSWDADYLNHVLSQAEPYVRDRVLRSIT